MKRVVNGILVLTLILALGYNIYRYTLAPCDEAIEYSIGRFDTNFGISEEQFRKYVQNSEALWEKALNKNVFEYNPTASFTVNLIYDERQRETIQKQKTESGLEAAENFFKNLDAKFNAAKAVYDSRLSSYESAKMAFEERAVDYEREVNYWNARKGALREKYEELEAERIALNNMASSLNAEAEKLKELSYNLNKAVEERNGAVEDYNRAVKAYNQKYGGHLEFNQAEYTSREINIYQFTDRRSLEAAMAHEFGHALTMDHVENSKSIMYYLRDSENLPSTPTPTAEDLTELKRVCKL